MAKVSVVGDAVVIASTMKLEEIKLVEKYRQKALVLYGGEDGKEPLFRVGTGAAGSVNEYGISFNGETRDDDKLATMTMCLDMPGATAEEVKAVIADEIGSQLAYLAKLEEKLPAVVSEIKAEREEILAGISVQ